MRWLGTHWLAVTNAAAGGLLVLAVVAPLLQLGGFDGPARLLYQGASPICHQMAQRSFFIGGAQPVYPSAAAGTAWSPIERYLPDLAAFDGVAPSDWAAFSRAAAAFTGSDRLGYKLALCQRMCAILFALLLGGLVFAALRGRRSIAPLGRGPLLLFAMMPIALDGGMSTTT